MRLVVLDGHTLYGSEEACADLQDLGEVVYYQRTSDEDIAPRLRNADMVLTNKEPISKETIAASPKLRYIGVTATGYNMVDMAAARTVGITVTNVPGYSTDSVAQTVFALLLEITHQTGHHAQRVADGAWAKCPDFSFADFPILELAGQTMGIVGFGDIGQAVGRIAHGFGMKVVYHTRTKKPFDAYPAEYVDQATLFREADVITLHCPLTPENKGFVSWPLLQTMKRSAILINTARGLLLNESDVARALKENVIAWAGLDVLSGEPPTGMNPLLNAPHCFILPHLAWSGVQARQRLKEEIIANLRAFLDGKPRNVVP